MISEEDRAWIKLLVHEAVTEAMAAERELVKMAIDTHSKGEDHIAFRAYISDVERKREQWDKIKTSIIGAIAIGGLFWVGSHVVDIAGWITRLGK